MMRISSSIAATAAVVFAFGCESSSTTEVEGPALHMSGHGTAAVHLGAHLTGANTLSRGQGQANFKLSGGDLSFVLALSTLVGVPTAAHIHISATPGGNGPPRVSLCGAFGPPPIPVAECQGPGAVNGMTSLSEAQIADLLTAVSEDRAYVNVHTTAFPPGEVRGQVARRR